MVGHYQHKERPYNTETLKIALREIRDGASIEVQLLSTIQVMANFKRSTCLLKNVGKVLNHKQVEGRKGGRRHQRPNWNDSLQIAFRFSRRWECLPQFQNFLRKRTISACLSEIDWTDKITNEIKTVETKFILYGPVLPEMKGIKIPRR